MRAADYIELAVCVFGVVVALVLAFGLASGITLGSISSGPSPSVDEDFEQCLSLLNESATLLDQAIDRWRVELDPIFQASNE